MSLRMARRYAVNLLLQVNFGKFGRRKEKTNSKLLQIVHTDAVAEQMEEGIMQHAPVAVSEGMSVVASVFENQSVRFEAPLSLINHRAGVRPPGIPLVTCSLPHPQALFLEGDDGSPAVLTRGRIDHG